MHFLHCTTIVAAASWLSLATAESMTLMGVIPSGTTHLGAPQPTGRMWVQALADISSTKIAADATVTLDWTAAASVSCIEEVEGGNNCLDVEPISCDYVFFSVFVSPKGKGPESFAWQYVPNDIGKIVSKEGTVTWTPSDTVITNLARNAGNGDEGDLSIDWANSDDVESRTFGVNMWCNGLAHYHIYQANFHLGAKGYKPITTSGQSTDSTQTTDLPQPTATGDDDVTVAGADTTAAETTAAVETTTATQPSIYYFAVTNTYSSFYDNYATSTNSNGQISTIVSTVFCEPTCLVTGLASNTVLSVDVSRYGTGSWATVPKATYDAIADSVNNG